MKKVIIVGASSGIGLGVAEALASRGIKVGLGARHTTKLKELKERYPENVEYVSIDVTHHDAEKKLAELIDKTGGMDIYFHVAGVGTENLLLDPEEEVRILRTNVEGFARMTCIAYRYFRSNGIKGQIAAVTSVAGTNGMGRLSAYSSSKKFDQTYLVALEQLANAEGSGVTFTDIRPGWIRTPLINSDRAYPMEMTVEYVVPLIIKAIVRKKRVAYIDWRFGLLSAAWKMVPDCLWTHMHVKLSEPDIPLPSLQAQREAEAPDLLQTES